MKEKNEEGESGEIKREDRRSNSTEILTKK